MPPRISMTSLVARTGFSVLASFSSFVTTFSPNKSCAIRTPFSGEPTFIPLTRSRRFPSGARFAICTIRPARALTSKRTGPISLSIVRSTPRKPIFVICCICDEIKSISSQFGILNPLISRPFGRVLILLLCRTPKVVTPFAISIPIPIPPRCTLALPSLSSVGKRIIAITGTKLKTRILISGRPAGLSGAKSSEVVMSCSKNAVSRL